MSPLELINHMRQCSLAQVRKQLEKLEKESPGTYALIQQFIIDSSQQPK